MWDNKVFQFRALPFGLAIAPLVFTKICQVVSAHLHTLSIQIHSYLDDSLVKELNPDSYRPPPRTRFPDFLEEIGGHSVSGFRFPRRTFQDGLGSCVSSRGEFVGSSSVYSNLSGQDLSHCSSIFTTASFIFSSIGPRLFRIGKPLFLSWKFSLLIFLGGCRGKMS